MNVSLVDKTLFKSGDRLSVREILSSFAMSVTAPITSAEISFLSLPGRIPWNFVNSNLLITFVITFEVIDLYKSFFRSRILFKDSGVESPLKKYYILFKARFCKFNVVLYRKGMSKKQFYCDSLKTSFN